MQKFLLILFSPTEQPQQVGNHLWGSVVGDLEGSVWICPLLWDDFFILIFFWQMLYAQAGQMQ